MYRRHGSRGSSSPAARMNGLLGIQYSPDDALVVPPTSASRSSITTERPTLAAVTAAAKPAIPVPTTTTSASRSQSSLLIRSASLRSDADRGGRVVARRGVEDLLEPGGDVRQPRARG